MAVPRVGNDYVLSILFTLLIYVVLTEAYVLFSDFTGYVNLGMSAGVGLGSYVMVLLQSTLPFPAIVALGALSGVGLAFVIGLPSLRVRGPYFAILTLGAGEILQFIILQIQIARGDVESPVFGPDLNYLYYFMVGLAPVSILILKFVAGSKLGLGLRSIKSDEEVAEQTGVNTTWYKLTAFAISFSMAGALGPILSSRLAFIDPFSVFSPLISFQVVVMAMFGGRGSVLAPIIGATFITFLHELLTSTYPYEFDILLGSILIFVVLVAPQGILGLLRTLAAKMGR
jgi:branched-chain amino acid transport system permease protein